MARRKKTSFTFQRLLIVSLFLIGTGFCVWYLFIRPNRQDSIQLQPLPEGFVSHGIDVSHHQGTIDWAVFLEEMDTTISFVYFKVTEGATFVDSQWKRNHSELLNSHVKYGGYHFFTPDLSAERQAYHFLNQYEPKEDELPPVLDAEVEASTPENLISGMKEWLRIVEDETGIRPIIYTSYSLYRDRMKGKLNGYQFWIASYNSDDSRVQDDAIIHWQYSDRGKVAGISELVDLNFSKQSFQERVDLAD